MDGVIVYQLRCPWCGSWMEKTDLYLAWQCPCGFYVEGKHFDRAVRRGD